MELKFIPCSIKSSRVDIRKEICTFFSMSGMAGELQRMKHTLVYHDKILAFINVSPKLLWTI